MSTDMKSQDTLRQHALLQQLREQTVVLEDAQRRAEQELLDFQAELEAKQKTKVVLQEQADAFHRGAEEMERALLVQLERLRLLGKRQDMLRDVQGFLMGTLFFDSGRGAVFFTHSLRAFAERLSAGEMQIEAAAKQSIDGVTLSFQDKIYCWLKGADGALYFHPEAVTKEFL